MAFVDRRVVAITGVTRGLGRSMARGFARLGHVVLGCGRSAEAIGDLARELGPPHGFESVDVADEAEVRSWAADLLRSHGPPDLLLNNAATINANAPLW